MNEPEVAAAFQAFFIVFVMCLIVLSWAISVLIFCRLFHKAGYHWALGFLSIVPVINFFAMPVSVAGATRLTTNTSSTNTGD